MNRGTHHGGNDSHTSPGYYGVRCSPEQYHHYQAEFEAVLAYVTELDRKGIAQLIYTRDDEERHVVAYRFTSDVFYNEHYWEVHSRGPSLARGSWQPFRDDWTFREWLGDDRLTDD